MVAYRPEHPEAGAPGAVEKKLVDAMAALVEGRDVVGEFRFLQYDGKGQKTARPMVELERVMTFKRTELLAAHGLDAAGTDEEAPGALRKLALKPVEAQNLVADLKDLAIAEMAAKTLYHLAHEETPLARQSYWKDGAFKAFLKSVQAVGMIGKLRQDLGLEKQGGVSGASLGFGVRMATQSM